MQEVFRHIEDHTNNYIAEVQTLLREPSMFTNTLGIESTVAILEKILKRIGCEVHTISVADSKPFLYGEIGEGDCTLLIYNHYDVQPVEPLNRWDLGPFLAEIQDGHIYARGAADNKGNLYARLAAIEAYLRVKGKLPCKVKFLFEGEEEVGSPHMAEFVRKHRDLVKADICLWESGFFNHEGRPCLNFGLKGLAYLEMRCKTLRSDMHSSWAGIVENPAWRLIHALATIRDQEGRIRVDELMDHVVPPSEEGMRLLETIDLDLAYYRDHYELRNFLSTADDHTLKERYFFWPTCNIAGIHSGYTKTETKTVIPNDAWVNIDFRLVPDLSPELVVGLLRSHLNRAGYPDIEIKLKAGMAPYYSRPSKELLERVNQVSNDIFHTAPVYMPMLAGSGPMHDICFANSLPVISFGIAHQGSHLHAPNENIRVQDLVRGIKFVSSLLELVG